MVGLSLHGIGERDERTGLGRRQRGSRDRHFDGGAPAGMIPTQMRFPQGSDSNLLTACARLADVLKRGPAAAGAVCLGNETGDVWSPPVRDASPS